MAALQQLTPKQIQAQASSVGLVRALLDCSGELREHALNMLDAINDPDADDMDREFAAITLAELLDPDPTGPDGRLGYDLAELEARERAEDPEVAAVLDAMDAEEATFASRLDALMREQGVTQTALAERVGLHQSAISMMLSRDCRPQKRTVTKLAAALNVEPATLWPNFAAKS